MRLIRRQFALTNTTRMSRNPPFFGDFLQQPAKCPRHQTIERWVARRLGRVDHERRVATISASLFDLTWPLHQLPESHLELLRFASLVHDVGRSVDKAHPPRAGGVPGDVGRVPAPVRDRTAALAYLTRIHKGFVPEAGREMC